MLRNRSRTVTKQPIMATDHQTSLPSPTRTRPVSPFFGSPRFFTGFSAKGLRDTETTMSPTSILDPKQPCNFGNPFGLDKILSKPTNIFQETNPLPLAEKFDQEGIGLALIEEKFEPNSRKVVVGSKLKIQIPRLPPPAISPTGSPKSPGDFGTKTRNSQFCTTPTAFGTGNSSNQTRDSSPYKVSTGPLSLSEMEHSEEYTCVISRGPVPKTTHIYDDCIVESCCGGTGVAGYTKLNNLKTTSLSFLSFCHTCRKSFGQDRDIYMYRGEKGFCSEECRCQEMLLDGVKN